MTVNKTCIMMFLSAGIAHWRQRERKEETPCLSSGDSFAVLSSRLNMVTEALRCCLFLTLMGPRFSGDRM